MAERASRHYVTLFVHGADRTITAEPRSLPMTQYRLVGAPGRSAIEIHDGDQFLACAEAEDVREQLFDLANRPPAMGALFVTATPGVAERMVTTTNAEKGHDMTETVDQSAARVLDEHLLQGPRPGQCRCGWGDGTDIRTLGRSHSKHVVEKLRAAGVLEVEPALSADSVLTHLLMLSSSCQGRVMVERDYRTGDYQAVFSLPPQAWGAPGKTPTLALRSLILTVDRALRGEGRPLTKEEIAETVDLPPVLSPETMKQLRTAFGKDFVVLRDSRADQDDPVQRDFKAMRERIMGIREHDATTDPTEKVTLAVDADARTITVEDTARPHTRYSVVRDDREASLGIHDGGGVFSWGPPDYIRRRLFGLTRTLAGAQFVNATREIASLLADPVPAPVPAESEARSFAAPRGPDKEAHQLDAGEYDILIDPFVPNGIAFSVFDVTNGTPLIAGMSQENLKALVMDSVHEGYLLRTRTWVEHITASPEFQELRPEVTEKLSEQEQRMWRIGTLVLGSKEDQG